MAATVPTAVQPKSAKPKKAPRVIGPNGPTWWDKIVERKWLAGSVAFHGLLAVVFAYWYLTPPAPPAKKFMKPGGGAEAARQGSEHKVSLGKKQSTMSAPEQAKRVTTTSSSAKIALPEMPIMPAQTTDVFANREAGVGGTGSAFGQTGTPGGGGNGNGSGISFFGLRTRAKSVVFLVDLSSSMVMSYNPPAVPGKPAPSKIVKDDRSYAVLEREVVRVIKQLDAGITFNVICFAGEVLPYRTGMGPANETEKMKAIKFVQERSPALNIVSERKQSERAAAGFKQPEGTPQKSATGFNHGGTVTAAALESAFALNPDVICLVSDGVPTDKSAASILTIVQDRQKTLPRPAVINVIAYLADSGQDFMKALAEQNQGSFKEIKPGMQSMGF
jgi:hypothetical protein